MPSFQVPVLGFAVRFLSLFPASLPQPFHRCLPSALTSGPFHFRLPSFRPFLFRFQLLSFLFLPFLSLPASASQWLPRCALSALASLAFPVLSDLVSHVFLPGSSYSAPCSSFPPRCLAPQWLPQRLRLLPFGSRLLPLGFRFRFWLLGLELYPFRYLSVASFSVLSQRPWLDYHTFFYLSTTFLKFFIIFSNFY